MIDEKQKYSVAFMSLIPPKNPLRDIIEKEIKKEKTLKKSGALVPVICTKPHKSFNELI